MEKVLATNSDFSDYERLKTLYAISQKLSVFKNVDESFLSIVKCASESFPLLSAVLIEHWEKVPRTAVWFSAGATKTTVARAIINAKTNYSFLAGATIFETSNFLDEFSSEVELGRDDQALDTDEMNVNNYIIMPLMIDNLPPLGAIQLEGVGPLGEKDLEFVNALTSLVSVALDRFYKTKKERAFNSEETRANLKAISISKGKVKELELERSLREDFVSLLTHDLKSPLSVIMGAAELICRRKDAPEPCLNLGRMIVKQSKQVTKMINNLLDANKVRSGQKLTLNLERINLNSLVVDTINELKLVHGNRFEMLADHSIEISCDVDGIRRILDNLCNNAVKYGSADANVKIFLEESKADVKIKVHNLGRVISYPDQKSIFQQFHRTEEAQKGLREGWGIGLTLVRGVAEAHGGSVEVESTPERGTFFIVNLPKDVSFLN